MESTEETKNIFRSNAFERWLKTTCAMEPFTVQSMPGDASSRRYFRIYTSAQSFVAMDAPLPHEHCRAYVDIAKALRTMGLHAPDIIHADLDQGFLLITDFGELTFLNALHAGNADQLYCSALTALSVLQSCNPVPGRQIPLFNREWMWQEWAWHKEWFLSKLLGLQLTTHEKDLDLCFAQIVDVAAAQPQVFMHRDYHSANLMVLPDHAVGILDFQDAFMGPVTYDVVSLLRDCYIDWPKERVMHWALFYLQQLQQSGVLCDVEQKEFLRWFDWMGMERHLKALFTFARKQVRDHQSHYLKHVPRTLGYLLNVSQRYPELTVLNVYFKKTVQPAFERMMRHHPCAP